MYEVVRLILDGVMSLDATTDHLMLSLLKEEELCNHKMMLRHWNDVYWDVEGCEDGYANEKRYDIYWGVKGRKDERERKWRMKENDENEKWRR